MARLARYMALYKSYILLLLFELYPATWEQITSYLKSRSAVYKKAVVEPTSIDKLNYFVIIKFCKKIVGV